MCRIVSLVILVSGGLTSGIGAIVLGGDLAFRLGLLLVAAGMVCFLRAEFRVTHMDLERARQAGYDDGYDDGREVARPTVIAVPWLQSSADRPSLLAGPSPAEQFRQQRDIRHRAQRRVVTPHSRSLA